MPEPDASSKDRALDELLEEGLRAETWRDWRHALEGRAADLKRERNELAEGADPAEIDRRILEMQAQIDALATEEIISEFVESEVVLAMSLPREDDEDAYLNDSG